MLLLCNARSLDRDLVVVECDYAFSPYVYRKVLWCLATNHLAVKGEFKSDTESRTTAARSRSTGGFCAPSRFSEIVVMYNEQSFARAH